MSEQEIIDAVTAKLTGFYDGQSVYVIANGMKLPGVIIDRRGLLYGVEYQHPGGYTISSGSFFVNELQAR